MENTCKKASFKTKEEATARALEINLESKAKKKPIRGYPCKICGQFHLTSWSKKKKIAVNLKHKIGVETSIQNRLESEAEYWSRKKQWK